MGKTFGGAVWQGHSDADYLVLRQGVWQFRRWVPRAIAHLDGRGEIRISTGHRDRIQATQMASKLNQILESYWQLLLETERENGSFAGLSERFDDAVRLARRIGVSYVPAFELAQGPLDETLGRVEQLAAREQQFNQPVVQAMLGGAARPSVKLSELSEAYEKFVGDRLLGKSEEQIRKWRATRARAIAHLIELVGDKPINEITRGDALDFKTWWLDRVKEEGYDQGSANKDIGCLSSMLKTMNEAYRLDLDVPFAGLRLAGEKHHPRIAYDPDFVRGRILPGTELAGLNAEARGVVVMVAATGMRPSEIVGLMKERIKLEGDVPYVEIRPDVRHLKTDQSVRDLPLVGRALEVMQAFPDGFARYRNSPDALSAVANKALGSAGLRPTQGHTLYSLRHTFKDRLIAIEVPQRIQDELMGHALKEIAYGSGATLRHKADWLRKVWS